MLCPRCGACIARKLFSSFHYGVDLSRFRYQAILTTRTRVKNHDSDSPATMHIVITRSCGYTHKFFAMIEHR